MFAYYDVQDQSDNYSNTKMGLTLGCIFLIVFGLLVFPTGPFIRPNPLFWRFFFGVAVCYELFLIFVFAQSKNDARQLFRFYDEKLGVPLEERLLLILWLSLCFCDLTDHMPRTVLLLGKLFVLTYGMTISCFLTVFCLLIFSAGLWKHSWSFVIHAQGRYGSTFCSL